MTSFFTLEPADDKHSEVFDKNAWSAKIPLFVVNWSFPVSLDVMLRCNVF